MALLDLLGRRWSLRVLWELRDGSAPSFRELQARLRDAGIVDGERAGGYRLTREGRTLIEALAPMDAWAKRWARRTAG
jgi:DNA-binding HxlR family transcriptional regulator